MAAALIFFCGWDELCALVLAAAVHESGHLLALWALGCRVKGLRLDGFGASIGIDGVISDEAVVLAALSGPVAGFVGAFLLSAIGREFGSPGLYRAAGLSLALSLFNLLPALPLDGGRVIAALAGERAAKVCGGAVSLCLLGLGLYLIACGAGGWLFIAGLWLTLMQAGL